MSEQKDKAEERVEKPPTKKPPGYRKPPTKKPPGYRKFEKLLKQVVKAPPLKRHA